MNKSLICTATVLACSILTSVAARAATQIPAGSQPPVLFAWDPPAPAAAPAATVELPTIRKGMNGGAVRLLQNILVTQKALTPNDVTGYFGDNTEQAVKSFQRNYNLPADGVVGAATWRMLGGTLWD